MGKATHSPTLTGKKRVANVVVSSDKWCIKKLAY